MALPPLPEDARALNRFRTVNGSMASQGSQSNHGDKERERIKHSTLENAGLIARAPPQSLSSYQAQVLSRQPSFSSLDQFGRYSSLSSSKHFSTATASSSSSISSRQDSKYIVPPSPVGTEYSIMMDEHPQMTISAPYAFSKLGGFSHGSMTTISSMSNSMMSGHGETASMLTTSSGGSSASKKALKLEKKA